MVAPSCGQQPLACPVRTLLPLPFRLMRPLFWGAAAAYYALVASLVLVPDVAIVARSLRHLDSSLGVPIVQRAYVGMGGWTSPSPSATADACALTLGSVWAVLDLYVPIHFSMAFFVVASSGSWALGALLSVEMEVIEWALRDRLPNFRECWWDTLLLDLAVTDAGGVLAGLAFYRWWYLGGGGQDNASDDDAPTVAATTPRPGRRSTGPTPGQAARACVCECDTMVRLAVVVAVFGAMLLSPFLLKHALWVPPSHPAYVGVHAVVDGLVLSALVSGRRVQLAALSTLQGVVCCRLLLLPSLVAGGGGSDGTFAAAAAAVSNRASQPAASVATAAVPVMSMVLQAAVLAVLVAVAAEVWHVRHGGGVERCFLLHARCAVVPHGKADSGAKDR